MYIIFFIQFFNQYKHAKEAAATDAMTKANVAKAGANTYTNGKRGDLGGETVKDYTDAAVSTAGGGGSGGSDKNNTAISSGGNVCLDGEEAVNTKTGTGSFLVHRDRI